MRSSRPTWHRALEYDDRCDDEDDAVIPMPAALRSAAVSEGQSEVDLTNAAMLGAVYERCIRPLQFDTYSMKARGSYQHHYASKISSSASSKEKILRLAQEQSTLCTSLPLSVDSSVFLRVGTSFSSARSGLKKEEEKPASERANDNAVFSVCCSVSQTTIGWT